MSQFNIHTAKSHFSELVQKAMLGEEVIIAKDHKPVVKLVPIHSEKPSRRLGTAKGLLTMASDFDAPLEDFTAYQ